VLVESSLVKFVGKFRTRRSARDIIEPLRLRGLCAANNSDGMRGIRAYTAVNQLPDSGSSYVNELTTNRTSARIGRTETKFGHRFIAGRINEIRACFDDPRGVNDRARALGMAGLSPLRIGHCRASPSISADRTILRDLMKRSNSYPVCAKCTPTVRYIFDRSVSSIRYDSRGRADAARKYVQAGRAIFKSAA